MLDEKQFQQRMRLIEELVRKLEASADPGLRATARELVQSLMDIHGAGVERMVEIVAQAGDPGRDIIETLGRDPLARSLLLLYGLHPVDFETRVLQALEKVRPHLHGGSVELLRIEDGAVRLRLEASGQGCGSSAQTVKSAVEEAIYDAAPDVTALVIEGAADHASSASFVPLAKLQGVGGAAIPARVNQP